MMNSCSARCLCIALTVVCAQVCGGSNDPPPSNDTRILRLLTLVPFPDSRLGAGWDRGLELLPAARLAVKHINQRLDTLQGYHLELVEARTDACGVKTVFNSLLSFTQHAVVSGNASNVVGIVGLACSSVATVISPLAGRQEVSLLQLSMGNSPVFQNHTRYPHLWRVLPSSRAFVDSVMKIMERFGRTNVSVIYNEGGYFTATAREFIKAAKDNKRNVTFQGVVVESEQAVNRILSSPSRLARIIFTSVTRKEAALLLCKAFKLQLYWPGYLWIFHTRTVKDIIKNVKSTSCSEENLYRALEMSINLEFQFHPLDKEQPLVSNKTFIQYQQEYVQALEELKVDERYRMYQDFDYSNDSVWANVMYDEVWALASALNRSLPELRQHNLSLENFYIGNSNVTEIIEKHFLNVSFAGTIGKVSFDPVTHEGQTPIRILQVQNKSHVMISEFDPKTGNILFWDAHPNSIPKDAFEKRYVLLPPWATSLLSVYTVAVAALVTFNMVIVLWNWNSHIIKATTPSLSILIFFGSYILCLSAVTMILLAALNLPDEAMKALYSMEILLFTIGSNLIFGTVVVKLARIFRIFSPFAKMGSAWKDKYLFTGVLVIVGLGTVPGILGLSLDPLSVLESTRYDYDTNPPVLLVERVCVSENVVVWFSAIWLYETVLLFFMIFFAYQTRKANMKNFKDTKKIIIYVCFTAPAFVLHIALFGVISALNKHLEATVVNISGNLIIALTAQVFLYIPKVLPLLFKKHHFSSTRNSKSHRSTLFFFSYF